MKKIILTTLTIAMFSTLTFSQQINDTLSKTSQSEFRHSINSCPFAPAFGIFSINYEFLFRPHHGLVARFDYEAIPKRFEERSIPENYPDAFIKASGWGFIVNYRWHISGELNSIFIGVYSRYRQFNGTGLVESTDFEFTVSEITAGINAGKRWVWKNGFNINMGFGYGFSKDTWNSTPANNSTEAVLDTFKDSYDFFDPFYGELSIGYAF